MSLKKSPPLTPGMRGLVKSDRSFLWKGKPLKSLSFGKKSSGGRNNTGRTTCWHKGSGHKKSYRQVDFKRDKNDISAMVERIEYDPNRSSFIAMIKYEDDTLSYIICPADLKKGDKIMSSDNKIDDNIGYCMPLEHIPIGASVHNIELKPNKGGQLVRAAGTSARILSKDGGYAKIKIQSSEIRYILLKCKATIGSISNAEHQHCKKGKAGRQRWLGVRPTVRGVAMNPVDHPHGGGEGKTSGGRHPSTPWGKSTKGKKTRRNKSSSKFIIQKRKK